MTDPAAATNRQLVALVGILAAGTLLNLSLGTHAAPMGRGGDIASAWIYGASALLYFVMSFWPPTEARGGSTILASLRALGRHCDDPHSRAGLFLVGLGLISLVFAPGSAGALIAVPCLTAGAGLVLYAAISTRALTRRRDRLHRRAAPVAGRAEAAGPHESDEITMTHTGPPATAGRPNQEHHVVN